MIQAVDMTSMFRWIRLWGDAEPVLAAPPKPLPPLPPLPMITYDKGLPSLPDDVTYEIFSLLDLESLKSCSLTGKAVSHSTKPFIHRTLSLTPRNRDRVGFWQPTHTPSGWNELKGLQILGECGLLQHTRHLSISLPQNPLFPHDLQPHVLHIHAITNLRSLNARWLDIPSFLSRMDEYFGTFLGSLESLELQEPRGDNQQVLYFICQFANLRNLRIKGVQHHTHSMRNGGPHFDINYSPPLDGTLDLELYTENSKGAMLILNNLISVPLRFRTLKLLGCSSRHSQLLIDACAATLESVDFTWMPGGLLHTNGKFSVSLTWTTEAGQCPRLNFERHPKLRKLEIRLIEFVRAEHVAAWLFETLSTITSNEFIELTIYIARVSYSFHTGSEDQVRGWNLVDDVLDRLSLCEDVALVVKPQNLTVDDQFKGLVETYFPLMWENGRVVLV